MHVRDEAGAKGCGLAIAYTDDVNSIKPEDFTVFSTNHTCVWKRETWFDIPADSESGPERRYAPLLLISSGPQCPPAPTARSASAPGTGSTVGWLLTSYCQVGADEITVYYNQARTRARATVTRFTVSDLCSAADADGFFTD